MGLIKIPEDNTLQKRMDTYRRRIEMDNWISCKTRLPSDDLKGEEFLVARRIRNFNQKKYLVVWFDFDTQTWIKPTRYGGVFYSEDILYWQLIESPECICFCRCGWGNNG